MASRSARALARPATPRAAPSSHDRRTPGPRPEGRARANGRAGTRALRSVRRRAAARQRCSSRPRARRPGSSTPRSLPLRVRRQRARATSDAARRAAHRSARVRVSLVAALASSARSRRAPRRPSTAPRVRHRASRAPANNRHWSAGGVVPRRVARCRRPMRAGAVRPWRRRTRWGRCVTRAARCRKRAATAPVGRTDRPESTWTASSAPLTRNRAGAPRMRRAPARRSRLRQRCPIAAMRRPADRQGQRGSLRRTPGTLPTKRRVDSRTHVGCRVRRCTMEPRYCASAEPLAIANFKSYPIPVGQSVRGW